MELFVEPGQNYTFLIELILSYLKLEERNKINLIALSPVAPPPLSPPSRQSAMANSTSRSPVS